MKPAKDKTHHTWPNSGHKHPVDEVHKVKGGKVHGEPTGSIDFFYPDNNYKEGK